jgi:hypothetical protein
LKDPGWFSTVRIKGKEIRASTPKYKPPLPQLEHWLAFPLLAGRK